MPRTIFIPVVLFSFLLSTSSGLKASALNAHEMLNPPADPEGYIDVADTYTTVMAVAKVHLSIGRLAVKDGRVHGSYQLDVPMRKAKNETGVLSLTSDHSLAELRTKGGRLIGKGSNPEQPGNLRSIICDIHPDPDVPDTGTLYLVIDTGKRVMEFESAYRFSAR